MREGLDYMLVPLKSLYTFFGIHLFLWQSFIQQHLCTKKTCCTKYLECKMIEYLNDWAKVFKLLTLESLVTWSLLLSLFSFLTAELALDEELLLTALTAASLLFLLPLSFFPSLASRSFLRAAAPPSLRAWPIFRLILVKQPEQHFLVPSGISVKTTGSNWKIGKTKPGTT